MCTPLEIRWNGTTYPGEGGGSRKKSDLCSKTRTYGEIGDFAAAGENFGELAPNYIEIRAKT